MTPHDQSHSSEPIAAPLSDLDSLWFRRHPEQIYRLRRQTPVEIEVLDHYPNRTEEGCENFVGFAIVSKKDGCITYFWMDEVHVFPGPVGPKGEKYLASFSALIREKRRERAQ